MRHSALVLTALAGLSFAGTACFVGAPTSPAPEAAVTNATGGSLADRMIGKAQLAIRLSPDRPDGLNLLAAAYLKKARETGSSEFAKQAEAALDRSLSLAPDNVEALGLRAAFLVTAHRFGEALEVARRAEAIRPDSPAIQGTIADALVELGRYEEAVTAAQAMMDLRPDCGSYARAAHLRALHGDVEGAVEALGLAVRAADPNDAESVAWCRVHLGNALMSAGRRGEGERELDLALDVLPSYHLALAAKARARAVAGDLEVAAELYARAEERVPLPDVAFALGDTYARLGRTDEARRQYDFAESVERVSGQTATPVLALHWSDRGERLDEALAVARRELAARADIYSFDLLAWCLYRSGDLAGARAASAEALRLGTRDPRIRYHAGLIALALGDRAGAASHLRVAVETRVGFDESHASFTALDYEAAARALASLRGG